MKMEFLFYSSLLINIVLLCFLYRLYKQREDEKDWKDYYFESMKKVVESNKRLCDWMNNPENFPQIIQYRDGEPTSETVHVTLKV